MYLNTSKILPIFNFFNNKSETISFLNLLSQNFLVTV